MVICAGIYGYLWTYETYEIDETVRMIENCSKLEH